jgi:predicted MFS family arabinose efflux permease
VNDSPSTARSYQLHALALLALINFINFADRTVILPLFPLLRKAFGASDSELGALQLWLQLVLALGSLPLGLLADRIPRTRVIAGGVIFWSLATFASGWAGTFAMLLLARALVGLGEAAYGPAAQSMISSVFSAEARARAQAVFAAGMLIGGAAGQALGGIIGNAHGWRPAFFVVGLPGIILGILALRLPEPPQGPGTELVPLRELLRVPAFMALMASGVLITFAGVSLLTWGPDYVVRYKGFSLREAGISLGSVGLLSLVSGVLTGGWVADRLQKKWRHGRALTVAIAFLLAAPCILWALAADGKAVVLGAFFVGGFFMSWYHGPVTAVIHDMMPARAHATSVGIYMFVTQLVGAFGPYLVGNISDARDLRAGLEVAVGILVLGALSFFLTAYFVQRQRPQIP